MMIAVEEEIQNVAGVHLRFQTKVRVYVFRSEKEALPTYGLELLVVGRTPVVVSQGSISVQRRSASDIQHVCSHRTSVRSRYALEA